MKAIGFSAYLIRKHRQLLAEHSPVRLLKTGLHSGSLKDGRSPPSRRFCAQRWNAWHLSRLNCQLVIILRTGCLTERFSEVGRAALPPIPLKASRGSWME